MRYLRAGLLSVVVVGGALCCGNPSVREVPDPLRSYDPTAIAGGDSRNDTAVYHRMGLIASGPPLSFVGNVGFFATPSPDTTLTIIALSLPSRGLTFSHERESYEAIYEVSVSFSQDDTEIRRIDSQDTVRVSTIGETNRTDESVLFRHDVRLPPGEYAVSYTVRDGAAGRDAVQHTRWVIPRLTQTSLSTPVVVYSGTPRSHLGVVPDYLPAPRASAVFGVDKSVAVYVEAYGTSVTTPLLCTMRDTHGSIVWRDTVWLVHGGEMASGIVSIPLTGVNLGIFVLSMVRPGGLDTVQTPLFTSFGGDLPAVSFDEMLVYLQFFANARQIAVLRSTPLSSRAAVWAAFLKATDTIPETSRNEGLEDYFSRIREANVRFRADAPGQGWLSDRGAVWVGLGAPDRVEEREGYGGQFSPMPGERLHVQIWEYRDLQARIIFYDAIGGEQWRLLPSSASSFRTLMARKLAR